MTELKPWARRSLLPPLVLLALLFPSGCANVFGKVGAGSASIAVSFSGAAAKTVCASAGDLLASVSSLSIAIVDSSAATVGSAMVAYSSGATKTFNSLAAGSYTVEVNAYASSGDLVATGSKAVTLSADATASVTVSLAFSSSTGTGGFSLPIRWPVSTGLAYAYATVDGAAIADPSVASGSTYYGATIAKSGLSVGSHLMRIYFKTASGATAYAGPYVESVNVWDGTTSTQWIDPSGAQNSERLFSASDFASDNASLAGLAASNADSTALTYTPTFSPSTTSYALATGFTGTGLSFVAIGVVGSQNLSCSWNGSAQSWSSIIGSTYTFTASGLQLVSGTNTFTVTVTAPDKQTTKSYTVSVACGGAGITISTPSPSYTGLGFPSSATIVQGSPFTLETSDATLDAITSGWTWYVNGVLDSSQTSQRYLLTSSATSGMIGTYSISGSIVGPDGVTYTGRTSLTVTKATLLTQAMLISTLSGVTSGPALTANYVLSSDLTLGDANFTPIGQNTDNTSLDLTSPFNGTFDGNGHTITLNLSSAGRLLGLFRNIGASGIVKNLKVVVTISSGNDWIGAIAAANYGTISNCSVSGTVKGNQYVGGLVGVNKSSGVISGCYSTAFVTQNANGSDIGGLVGRNYGTISNCYARGAVDCSVSLGGYAGGLVGTNASTATIKNCYSTGSVTTGPGSYYGGLLGMQAGSMVACFYDKDTSGMSDTGKGTGCDTAAMKTASTFSSWSISSGADSSKIWGIDSTMTINNGYPYLQYFGASTVTP
jgi:The GLUG motif.